VAVAAACQWVFLFAYQGVLAEHYARRAQNADALKKAQDVAAWARRSLDLNPHQGYAAFFAGVASREQGRTEEASRWFWLALRTMGHRAQALRELAECEKKTDDGSAAAKHLEEALAIEPMPPGGPAVRAERGQLLFGLGRWADGVAQFRLAVADAPASRLAFDGLTVGYQCFGALEPAVASAFALLGSPPFAARAGLHLTRLASLPAQKVLIITALKEMQSTLPPADPRHTNIENTLKAIVAGR
jgi:tetratricopeptide (TPR) repeat protein